MLNQEVVELINFQVNKELFSGYFYLDISNYYINENLEGFGHWFSVQAKEEVDHAMLFTKYLQNNGENVILESINLEKKNFKDFKEPLVETLAHERTVTASVHAIYDKAFENKDFRTMQFLDWFIKEQGEEEKNTGDLIKKYELFGKDGKGLYLLDAELKTRMYTPPSLVI